MAEEQKKSYKDSLNLPQTEFPIRAQSSIDDPKMIERWEHEKLSSVAFHHNAGASKYILHDGPPYANGSIHIGHAYNKTIKDIIAKSKRMAGFHVPITPGWDCHGLPIEFKVSQDNPGLSRTDLKRKCREYAQGWIAVQKDEFKKLGVLMDWDRPYLTMSPEYEAATVRAFGDLFDKGYVDYKNKTVPWCMSCKTVLAIAEIEYQERKDPSIYVLFPLEQKIARTILPTHADQAIYALIWTTTPWTLPLNRAVLFKPTAEYVVLEMNGKMVLVGAQGADALCAKFEQPKKQLATLTGKELLELSAKAHHPFIPGLHVPLIGDESVEITEGTAFVHCAPGAGPIDYEVGVKNNLEIYSPVEPDGKYSATVVPLELASMSVTDGQIWVIKKLAELDRMLHKGTVRHSYPHCWRCRQGLIFRATKQWFCDLSRHDLKKRAVESTHHIATVPSKSINRLKASIEGRLEWCLSRQRVWGTPIPALLCTDCGNPYTNKQFIDRVAEGVSREGIEYWDTVTIEELMPAGFSCHHCSGKNCIKEQDILDVWFDAGVSHYAVLQKNHDLAYPADLYLEGSDQHRGWFQSSLLTSVALHDRAAMKSIITHGYTVDQEGRKMSKSLGNVVSPETMKGVLGTDGLRLWASSIDFSGDAVISDVLTKNVQEVFRKIRNTCRFLLSNLYDFEYATDAIPLDRLRFIDQYALSELDEVDRVVRKGYDSYDLTLVFHTLGDYCAARLSSFYLDIIKDRLYVEKADGHERRSAQTVCWVILDTLTKLMAPILSFAAEQVSDLYQRDKKHSIHLQRFAQIQLPSSFGAEQISRWHVMLSLRPLILKAIELLRAAGTIKHSLEAHVTLCFGDADLAEVMRGFEIDLAKERQSMELFLKEFLIVSQVTIAVSGGDLEDTENGQLKVGVQPAAGVKCPRCWNWHTGTHVDSLCDRCIAVI